MKLHESREDFLELISYTSAYFELPQAYIEKDYFLTKCLYNLSLHEKAQHVVFKGGTSLSKVYKALYRFSEDIDLALLPCETWSENKQKKVLRQIFKQAATDLSDAPGNLPATGSHYKAKRFLFPRAFQEESLGEVTDTILLECNAYTTPTPFVAKKLRSLIAQWALDTGKSEIVEEFDLQDFEFQVLCWKRTFCEKILGLIAAAERDELGDKVRHFYDLTLLFRHDEIKTFLCEDDQFFPLMGLAIQSDINHAGDRKLNWLIEDLGSNSPFSNFDMCWAGIESAYFGAFQKMITKDEHTPSREEIQSCFSSIKSRLCELSSTQSYRELISK
ncbi:nucleotidyl transferase AbiEii/AbiGii toxin family protein [Vibrio vulnificus]